MSSIFLIYLRLLASALPNSVNPDDLYHSLESLKLTIVLQITTKYTTKQFTKTRKVLIVN